jgi:hypothetical protein
MNVPAGLPFAWGATASERAAHYPCDALVANPDHALVRAIDVRAPPAATFRWLCQLRQAPYSYDWIDNGGRRSPRRLTPGLEQLAAGQKFMRMFELVEFEPGRQVTLAAKLPRAVAMFGSLGVTYLVKPMTDGQSRLVVKLVVRYPRRIPFSWMRFLLPWGDLVMMRKQLENLGALAEATR